MLKGWIDRCFIYYFAYGGGNSLEGKKWCLSVTSGADESIYSEGVFGTLEDLLKPVYTSLVFLLKVELMPIFKGCGVKFFSPTFDISDFPDKNALVEKFEDFLKSNFS
mmetsp:Transcript_13375/g.6532  ORF Transcript_13375/g.6532 Transcript_13375/m.6532 type:complete len:108 (+) Transcript_13375:380-703(+)|eukprot:CAMPEP_0201281120 /NCGR_PEP_ID=MMETSP1317-20130820/1470_1 /ASSEMBLY_ACC=CAM_ASM_000770 /TAXON_ID=187299 /ORGANISM="Undescribed Undescribed, Strain Undescribed" /LENGTH=107 /DNA_ID=CAMNT_0047590145 /DNA_START=367 /DNA_END=690 /DNA_ORIENTATION=-